MTNSNIQKTYIIKYYTIKLPIYPNNTNLQQTTSKHKKSQNKTKPSKVNNTNMKPPTIKQFIKSPTPSIESKQKVTH